MKDEFKTGNRKVLSMYLIPAVIAAVLVLYSTFMPQASVLNELPKITPEQFQNGLDKCASFQEPKLEVGAEKRTRNPRYNVGGEDPVQETLLKNATLWNGDGEITYGVDIHFKDGLIVSVEPTGSVSHFDGVLIDTKGRFVTPGIVDMHSHMGLDSWPETAGGSDTNEMSDKIVRPELKSLDGFDPTDLAIQIINSGGVTTSLVLPGSGLMMGGEAFAFKNRKVPSNRAEHMLLNAGMTKEDGHQWRWMKMACGENSIRFGRALGVLPSSRLGQGYLFRKRFDDAFKVKVEQDNWCYKASAAKSQFKSHAYRHMEEAFPEDIDQESLIALLRGDILLNVHCYETHDIERMVRLSKEYGFKISAFHHALEAWKVADLLAEEDIGAAIFADHWGYKKEAYGSSTKAAKILTEKGVKVAFKSDHPVLNSQNLIHEAAKGHHFGLSAGKAIQSVTSIPAKLAGQDHRVGYLRKGYDADIVIWDKNPLEIGAHPLKVFVDGYSTFEHEDYSKTIKEKFEETSFKEANNNIWEFPETSDLTGTVTYENINGLVHSEDAKWEKGSKIVVADGLISCLGVSCESKGTVVDLKNGWVIPGIIASGVHLGLEVIESEEKTSAGYLKVGRDAVKDTPVINSSDGLRVGRTHSKLIDAAFKNGVTTAIVSLKFQGSVGAVGTAFRVGAPRLTPDAFVEKDLGQNFKVGREAIADGIDSSIPGQLSKIESKKVDTLSVINVEGANHIAAVLSRLGKSGKLIIEGGAEAYIEADSLAKVGASVILNPGRCVPSTWFTQDCKVTGSSETNLYLLQKAGVNVGVSSINDNIIWEAGWQVADLPDFSKWTDFERAKRTAALATWNVAKAYGIEDMVGKIAVGRRPNFVVYDTVPGSLSASVKLVVDGEFIETNTVQD